MLLPHQTSLMTEYNKSTAAKTKPGQTPPQYDIAQHVKRTMYRGFDTLECVKIATEMYQEEKQNQFPKDDSNLSTIEDFLEWYNQNTTGTKYQYPTHYQPYIEVLEKENENFRIGFSSAPQVGKTTITLIGMIWRAFTKPGSQQMYITYSLDRAKSVLTDIMVPMLRDVGIAFSVSGNRLRVRSLWNTAGITFDSIITFTSWGGGVTGNSVKTIIIDDIVSTAEEAFSPTTTSKIHEWYKMSVLTRNSSTLGIVIMMTRWSKNDLIGKLLESNQLEYIRVPAICDDEANDPIGRRLGEAIEFNGKNLEFFERQRQEMGSIVFESMYQGEPSPELSKFKPGVVKDVLEPSFSQHYNELRLSNSNLYITSYGIDLSYGGKDANVLVQLKTNRQTGESIVTHVISQQFMLYTDFLEKYATPFIKMNPGKCLWYAGAMEKGATVGQVKKLCPFINIALANKSKTVRAIDTIKAWNEGYLTVSSQLSDLHRFMAVIESFEGIKANERDDEVDALSAAYDLVKDIRVKVLRNHNPSPSSSVPRTPLDPFHQFNNMSTGNTAEAKRRKQYERSRQMADVTRNRFTI